MPPKRRPRSKPRRGLGAQPREIAARAPLDNAAWLGAMAHSPTIWMMMGVEFSRRLRELCAEVLKLRAEVLKLRAEVNTEVNEL